MVFTASVDELDNVLGYTEDELNAHGVSPAVTMSFLVAVEEIFVNIAYYAYPKDEKGVAEVDLDFTDNMVKVTFIDSGIEFDPLAKEDPDVTAGVEERRIGGLGIFMVKKSMDDVNYKREDGKNIFSFSKKY